LLNVTNQASKKHSIHGQGKSDQPRLEEVIEEMLNLHETDPNQQSRPNAWLSSDINIPDDFETGQAQSDITTNPMPMNEDDVEQPCIGSGLTLINVNVADSMLKDSKVGNVAFVDENHQADTANDKSTNLSTKDHMNVDPGINSFINAKFLQHDDPCYNCRQKVLNAHFRNCLIHTFATNLHVDSHHSFFRDT